MTRLCLICLVQDWPLVMSQPCCVVAALYFTKKQRGNRLSGWVMKCRRCRQLERKPFEGIWELQIQSWACSHRLWACQESFSASSSQATWWKLFYFRFSPINSKAKLPVLNNQLSFLATSQNNVTYCLGWSQAIELIVIKVSNILWYPWNKFVVVFGTMVRIVNEVLNTFCLLLYIFSIPLFKPILHILESVWREKVSSSIYLIYLTFHCYSGAGEDKVTAVIPITPASRQTWSDRDLMWVFEERVTL